MYVEARSQCQVSSVAVLATLVASECHGVSCLCLHSAGIIGVYHQAQLGRSGERTQVFMHAKQTQLTPKV